MNSQIIDSIEKNTDLLENTLESVSSTKNNLVQENLYLKQLVSNYLAIINKLQYEKNEPLEQTILKIFHDTNVKKHKNKYIKLNKLRLMLTLKQSTLTNEYLYSTIQNSKVFKIETIKGTLYVRI